MTTPLMPGLSALGSLAPLQLSSSYALSSGFGVNAAHFRKDNGVLKVEGMPVFRSGTFRDSWGDQFTYEELHIQQMITHWNYLTSSKIFADVPVRLGHPGFLGAAPMQGQVIGWHTQLSTAKMKAPHEDEEYDYVLADYEILDMEAAAGIERGLYRNRSAEIGRYRTNKEVEYWPVYMGVAYVDIPAVEGLQFQSNNSAGRSPVKYFIIDKEMSVTGQIPMNAPGQAASAASGTNGTGGLPFAIGAQAYRVNGQVTTDANAIQSHIEVLEQFRTQVTDQIRNDFVGMLAAMQRISVHDVPNQQAFARSLSGEQFAAWRATWGIDTPGQQSVQAPPQQQAVPGQFGQPTAPPILGPITGGQPTYSAGAAVAAPQGQANSAAAAQLAIHSETLRQFQLAGLPKATIEASDSYKALVAAGQTPKI